MIWYIVIYLIGYLLAYRMIRKLFKEGDDNYNWTCVILTIILSIGSFLSLVSGFLTYLVMTTDKKYKTKPPEWL